MSATSNARQLDIVGAGPSLGAPHAERLTVILEQSHCILWAADVEGLGDWRSGIDPSRRCLKWMPRVLNEPAAQKLLPLAIKPGSNYFEAWRDSRHRGDDRRMWETALGAFAQGLAFYQQVFRCFDKHGAEHWLHEHANIQVVGPGRWYVVGTAADITPYWQSSEYVGRVTEQLNRALNEQRESAAVLDVLLDCVPVGVALLSRDRRFLRVNSEFCRLNGVSESTVDGQAITQWVDSSLSAALGVHLDELLASGKPTAAQELPVTSGERERIWQLQLFPIGLAENQPLAAGVLLQDITQSREAEAVRVARQVAEAANAAKDQFLAMLSHELRMPLTPVLALTSVLEQDSRLPGDARDDLAMIRRNTQLEARLIDDLLDVTRIARGKLALSRQNCDINEIVVQAIHLCSQQFAQKNLALESSLGARHAVACVDPARMQQVITNLLINALKFTPAGGQVRISTADVTESSGACVMVQVRDSGIGISADSLPRIFDPFEQALELHDHQRQAGLGLGLAICRGLVEAHGGSIRAQSDGANRGATFTVIIPVVAEAAPAAPTCICAPRRGSGVRILMVEDHLDTARVMQKLLQRLKYHVTVASCVKEAVDLLALRSFDLLLSDLGLPDGTGRDILRLSGTRLPSIALSGFGTDEDIRQAKEAGFVEHLTKPVTMEQVQSAIARHIQFPREGQDAACAESAGQTEMNPL